MAASILTCLSASAGCSVELFTFALLAAAFASFPRAIAATIFACLSPSVAFDSVKPAAVLRTSVSAISAFVAALTPVVFLGAVLTTSFCALARAIATAIAACLSVVASDLSAAFAALAPCARAACLAARSCFSRSIRASRNSLRSRARSAASCALSSAITSLLA